MPLVASIGALALLLIVAAGVGSVPIPAGDVLAAVGRGMWGSLAGARVGLELEATRVIDTIVWQIRLPRVALAALVGAALGLAGAGFQGVFRNPLADPYLLGAASGAGFAASLAIVGGGAFGLGARGVPLAAFVGAAATVALVVALARRGWSLPIVPLVLAGVVVGSCLAAGPSFVLLA
ncbi:MAG: iron chelate uptake ABC transporter family permease subunit, partial [Trueperaceae bacterium]|nr:iron chelate uptake ABC transporter family permease subunit [Trueperaceae bacterium]